MIHLDDRLRALRAHAGTWAAQLRGTALELDRDPDAIGRFLDLPVNAYLATLRTAKTADADPLVVGRYQYHLDSVLEQVVFFEELSYGDVGALMAAPGAPMAGPLIDMLGDDDQQRSFFDRLRRESTWVFFALTEPDRGSDAGNVATRLEPDGAGWRLSGAKRYVGNATRGQLGVVFARERPGPLGVRAVLVERTAPGLSTEPLPTTGLRGAALGAITMDAVPVAREQLLGQHLPATRRGTWSWMQTFNRLRPRVAAMGIGIARAAHDYVRTHRTSLRRSEVDRLDGIQRRITGVQQLNYRAAVTVDADPADGHVASAAKIRAGRLAEDVTLEAIRSFGPGARFEHPELEKLVRDARGVEFMEGAGNVQKLIVCQHLMQGRIHHG